MGNNFVDFTELKPIGVTGHIVPWNFPLGMAFRAVAPALAAGCTVVLKPDENSSLSALALGNLISDVGFPKGVFNIVTGFGEEAGLHICENKLLQTFMCLNPSQRILHNFHRFVMIVVSLITMLLRPL